MKSNLGSEIPWCRIQNLFKFRSHLKDQLHNWKLKTTLRETSPTYIHSIIISHAKSTAFASVLGCVTQFVRFFQCFVPALLWMIVLIWVKWLKTIGGVRCSFRGYFLDWLLGCFPWDSTFSNQHKTTYKDYWNFSTESRTWLKQERIWDSLIHWWSRWYLWRIRMRETALTKEWSYLDSKAPNSMPLPRLGKRTDEEFKVLSLL